MLPSSVPVSCDAKIARKQARTHGTESADVDHSSVSGSHLRCRSFHVTDKVRLAKKHAKESAYRNNKEALYEKATKKYAIIRISTMFSIFTLAKIIALNAPLATALTVLMYTDTRLIDTSYLEEATSTCAVK